MTPIFKWLGSKASRAEEYASKLGHYIPEGGTYYEAFCGSACVGIALGTMRPDVKMLFTDTNKKLINAMKWIKQNGNKVSEVRKIALTMFKIADEKVDSYAQIKWYIESDDPVEWLAAVNCTRPTKNNYPYTRPEIARRLLVLKQAMLEAWIAFANADFIPGPCTNFRCDAAFFDPPYKDRTFKYDGEEYDIRVFLKLLEMYKKMDAIKYMLVTDHGSQDYPGFIKSKSDKKLSGWNSADDSECLYEWFK